MEPLSEPVELELLSQRVLPRGENNDKILVEVYQDGPCYRSRVPKYSDRSEVGTDCLAWWADDTCRTEKDAQDQGCKRAGIANDPQVNWECFKGSGKTRPYPPQ